MWNGLRRAFGALGEELFPTVCVGCRRVVARGALPICAGCSETIERIDVSSSCRVCARRFAAGPPVVCGVCSSSPKSFSRVSAYCVHGGAVADALARFKYGGEEPLARSLGMLLRAGLDGRGGVAELDVVIPVPLHLRRLRARGFNQAYLLAGYLGVPSLTRGGAILERVRDTPPQAGLSARERKTNVDGAFRVRPGRERAIMGARVLLVDDVLTTGATANECARILRDAGADAVSIAVVSRAE